MKILAIAFSALLVLTACNKDVKSDKKVTVDYKTFVARDGEAPDMQVLGKRVQDFDAVWITLYTDKETSKSMYKLQGKIDGVVTTEVGTQTGDALNFTLEAPENETPKSVQIDEEVLILKDNNVDRETELHFDFKKYDTKDKKHKGCK